MNHDDLAEALRLSNEASRLSAEMHLRYTQERYRRLTNPTRIERIEDRLTAWSLPIQVASAAVTVAAAIVVFALR